jgi:hypothetical protein
MKRGLLLLVVLAALAALSALPAQAHVHGITPLLTLANECGVTTLSNTGANREQTDVIQPGNLIPRDIGKAPLTGGDGGRNAPVGCVENGP